MTAVLAALLVLAAVVLCAAAWHTRHPDAPGVPDRENGALTAWDPAELREWTLELHHTKNTPPWPPLPHPDAAAGSQGGDHDWLAAPTPASLSPAAGMVAGEIPARPSGEGCETPAAGDPPMPAPSHPETWTDYHGPWTTRKVRADVPADPVADLTGAAERIRALSLDEYEAAFPGWEHGTGWFRAIDGGEVA